MVKLKHSMHFSHKIGNKIRQTEIAFDLEITFSGIDVIIGYVLIAIGGINLLATQFQIANLYKTRF